MFQEYQVQYAQTNADNPNIKSNVFPFECINDIVEVPASNWKFYQTIYVILRYIGMKFRCCVQGNAFIKYFCKKEETYDFSSFIHRREIV